MTGERAGSAGMVDLERDLEEAQAESRGNRDYYLRAHQLLCDLARRFKKALLPTSRDPDWDDLVCAAEHLAGRYDPVPAPGPEAAEVKR